MSSKQFLLVLGCLICMPHSRMYTKADTSSSQGQSTVAANEGDPGLTADDPEDNPNAALVRLQTVSTLDGFLDLLVDENGDNITQDALFSEYNSESGKQVIHGGGRMAEPDDCSPRNMTVRLEMPDSDPNDVFFPQCTRVERCGGCCSTRYLECVPAYTERVSLKVVKATAPFPGSPHLTYSGFAPVIVERHMRCVVQCTLNEQRCGNKKRFVRSQCDCKCREYKRCHPPQVWNPDTCDCECVGGERQCPLSILTFDSRTCRCVLSTGPDVISSDVNVTSEERTNYFNSLNGSFVGEEPIPTSTQSTSTTSTSTSTEAQPCRHTQCPSGLNVVFRNGSCTCAPNRHYRNRPRGHTRGRGSSRSRSRG